MSHEDARRALAGADDARAQADAVLEQADRRKSERRASDKLECPYCKSMQSAVVNCRPGAAAGGFWRRRKCAACGGRFTTEEVVRGVYRAAS